MMIFPYYILSYCESASFPRDPCCHKKRFVAVASMFSEENVIVNVFNQLGSPTRVCMKVFSAFSDSDISQVKKELALGQQVIDQPTSPGMIDALTKGSVVLVQPTLPCHLWPHNFLYFSIFLTTVLGILTSLH